MSCGNDLPLYLFVWLLLTETACNGSQKLILRRLDWVPRGLLFESLILFIIRILTFSVGQSCNYFLLSYLFNDYCRIDPILVLTAWPIKHERFTFHECFNGSIRVALSQSRSYWLLAFINSVLSTIFRYINLNWIAHNRRFHTCTRDGWSVWDGWSIFKIFS